MVKLNGAEYTCRPGLSLKELVATYNADHNNSLGFDEFVVLVNGVAITTMQAEERILLDNDIVYIVPFLAGG